MQKFFPLVLVIAIGLSAGGLVGRQTIRQQGRMFSVDSVAIKAGESLTFLNDDNVPHNIASISKGNEFDLGSQRPGTSTDVVFTEAGEVQVFCAIHPRMKLTVKVAQ
jgi:plastocyanin